jgi:hypothetical protein
MDKAQDSRNFNLEYETMFLKIRMPIVSRKVRKRFRGDHKECFMLLSKILGFAQNLKIMLKAKNRPVTSLLAN